MSHVLTRENLKLSVVATVTLLLAWTGPAVAQGVQSRFAADADRVDGRHAVGARASLDRAGGKLVAHDGRGLLPARFVPTSVKNRVHRYSVPDFAETSFHSMRLPDLPPGRYLASYSISVETTGRMDCGFFDGAGYQINGRAHSTGTQVTVHGTGVLDTRSDSHTFECFGSSPFTYDNGHPHYSQLTFLRMHRVVDDAGVSARRTVPRRGTGG